MTVIAVVIPTMGTKKTKQPVSSEEKTQLWGQMVRKVITQCHQALIQNGYQPHIILADNTKDGLSPQHQKQLAKLSVPTEIMHIPNRGPYDTILHCGEHAVQKRNASAIVTCFDDFITESAHLQKLVQPLRNRKKGFVFGRWTQAGLFSFPRSQIRNETTMSYLTTLANPAIKMQKTDSLPTIIERARQQGHDLQTFNGSYAMTAQTLQTIRRFLGQHIRLPSNSLWATEPLMMLAAIANGHPAIGVKFNRKFEHFYPKSEAQHQAHSQSRVNQFKDGVQGIRQFLQVTHQEEKIPLFERIVTQTAVQIPKTPAHWRPGSKSRLLRFQKARKKALQKQAHPTIRPV